MSQLCQNETVARLTDWQQQNKNQDLSVTQGNLFLRFILAAAES